METMVYVRVGLCGLSPAQPQVQIVLLLRVESAPGGSLHVICFSMQHVLPTVHACTA